MLPGETIHSGADPICKTCGKRYVEQVMSSNAGWFVGTTCCNDGTYSRESHYYQTLNEAQHDLDNNQVNYRT